MHILPIGFPKAEQTAVENCARPLQARTDLQRLSADRWRPVKLGKPVRETPRASEMRLRPARGSNKADAAFGGPRTVELVDKGDVTVAIKLRIGKAEGH